MSTRPIQFTDGMVRAILAGRKTQTRRLCGGGPVPRGAYDDLDFASAWRGDGPSPAGKPGPCLHVPTRGVTTHRIYSRIQPGDVLWVREAWRPANDGEGIVYRADGIVAKRWKQAMYMPRAASRITLAVESVRCERVQDICEADARAEGVDGIAEFADVWEQIYGGRPGRCWRDNPWVWVYEFRRVAQDTALRDAYVRAGEIHGAATPDCRSR